MRLEKHAIYLDSNASAPLSPRVIELARSVFSSNESDSLFPNPSSIHSHGRLSKKWLSEARDSVATSLGADPEQLIFTSSGTEANQLAIRSVFEPRLARGEKPHWITTPVEHDSVLQLQSWLTDRGGSV